jgi:hypothetical protein
MRSRDRTGGSGDRTMRRNDNRCLGFVSDGDGESREIRRDLGAFGGRFGGYP